MNSINVEDLTRPIGRRLYLTLPPRNASLQILDLLFVESLFASGAPMFGENREAGEIPARSRHCDVLEAADYSATDLESGRLPAAKMCD